ncbi:hypothetical protein [Alteromonas phage XX1924]|nr:hypothetical protein [Alteromonas phage XX1924]
MTSIFTGFTPTKPACDPIPNPKLPKNKPRTLDAKDAPAITTSVIGALSSSGIGAPSFIGAESSAGIAIPVNLGAESKVVISAPVSKTAESKAPVTAPSSKTAKTAVTIPAPSEKAAQAKASVDTPSNLGAENAATVSAPSSKTAQAKATISAPSNVGAESASAVPTPASKTAVAKPAVSAPSNKTAIAKPGIDAPSNLSAEAKASIAVPSSKTAENAATTPAPSSKTALAKASVPTPSAKSAQSASVTPAPSTLTANPATAVTPPFPLNHARILYDNVLQGYNSITDTGPTGTAINAIKPNTWERWKFSTAANTLIVDFSTAVDFDTVCIASHNLSNAGATIAVYYEPEPGGVFVKLGEKTPTNNEPICFYSETLLDALTIEIRITGASGVPQIGYVSAGESLQMQRPFFNGHIPITDGDVTEYYSNRTESGEIIGQQIRRQGYQTSADWRYIDDTWYRTYFDPFKKAAKLTPFFFMWNLLEYPDDVGFCRISQDINCPMQNGFTTKRTISMTLLGAG